MIYGFSSSVVFRLKNSFYLLSVNFQDFRCSSYIFISFLVFISKLLLLKEVVYQDTLGREVGPLAPTMTDRWGFGQFRPNCPGELLDVTQWTTTGHLILSRLRTVPSDYSLQRNDYFKRVFYLLKEYSVPTRHLLPFGSIGVAPSTDCPGVSLLPLTRPSSTRTCHRRTPDTFVRVHGRMISTRPSQVLRLLFLSDSGHCPRKFIGCPICGRWVLEVDSTVV